MRRIAASVKIQQSACTESVGIAMIRIYSEPSFANGRQKWENHPFDRSIDLPIAEVERASSKKEQERQSENIQNCKIKEHIFFFWRSYYVKYFSSQIALKIGSLGRTQGTLKITSEIMTARNQARIRNKLFARKMSRISSNEPRAI